MADPFIDAVEEARRLHRSEGKDISIRELARRSGINFRTLHYNLTPNGQARRRSPDLIERLAQVLPISAEELTRAAVQSGGYSPNDDDGPSTIELLDAVAALIRDERVSEKERHEFAASLLEMISAYVLRTPRQSNGQPTRREASAGEGGEARMTP